MFCLNSITQISVCVRRISLISDKQKFWQKNITVNNNFRISVPGVVKDAIGRYRDSNDWFSIFIEDCCEVDKTYIQKSGEFYQEYRAYCARNGEFTRSTTEFYTALENAGFLRKKTKSGNVIMGLQLKSDFIE